MKKILILCFSGLFSSQLLAQGSVLGSGDWYKIGITQTGIHKIDATFLRNAGINTATLNPKNLRLYGNGGRMLPQKNADFRYDDLTENAILVSGEADGKFDDSDYLLFFGQSPHEIVADKASRLLSHRYNIYSDTTYYFLNVASQPGLRVQNQPSFTGNATPANTFDDYFFYEKDQTNLCQSGREWFDSDNFINSITDRKYNFSIPGLAAATPLSLTASVAATVNNFEQDGADSSSFAFQINGTAIGKQGLGSLIAYKYSPRGTLQTHTFLTNTTQTGTPDNLQITLTFNKSTGNYPATGYLNYLGINARRQLKLYDNQTRFRNFDNLTAALSFAFPADNTLQLWDVTNPLRPQNQAFSLNGSQGSFGSARSDTLKEFVIFSGNGFNIPVLSGKIANQNLHALATPDLLIISPDGFLTEAGRLAAFRMSHDGLKTAVVSVSQVFNEFSSGMQDVTAIRDFVRYLYKRGNLKYVLLFGDASYDYKNRISSRFTYQKNTIPVYESRSSLNYVTTYSSDDYFGFMDDNEGEWAEDDNTMASNHTLDVGVGRLPMETPDQARQVVDKLMYYAADTRTLGKWRQRVSFVADNGDSNQHQSDAEFLSDKLTANSPGYYPNKIYLDNYKEISYGNVTKIPAANAALDKAVNEGSLIVNYAGHGGEIGWAQEQILTIPQMQGYRNLSSMPLFVTATCEFGRYDNPLITSGAELLLLNANGGSIGLLTTTRPVFSSTNLLINSAFYDAVFQPVNGSQPRLGDVMRSTKNNAISGVFNRNFALLSDPSLKLAYPRQNIALTQVNGKPPGTDTLRAMATISLQGEVRNDNNLKISDFNGTLWVTVFDKNATAQTLGQEGYPMTYKVQDRVIYTGQVSVVNGSFTTTFVLPKDIDYRFGTGKISLYAQSSSGYADAGGFQKQPVGGTALQVAADDIPPQVTLFLDSENFVSGGTTGETPLLLARLSDDNGINVSKIGIGHEVSAFLDNRTDSLLILNEFYTPDPDTYKSGKVQYTFGKLNEGRHTLTLKAWDTHNNSGTGSLDFVVARAGQINLQHFLVYPNPADAQTTFRFDHDRAGDDLEIDFEILNLQGKMVKNFKTQVLRSEKTYDGYNWQLKDENLAPGLYIYRVVVRSLTENIGGQFAGKLIIVK